MVSAIGFNTQGVFHGCWTSFRCWAAGISWRTSCGVGIIMEMGFRWAFHRAFRSLSWGYHWRFHGTLHDLRELIPIPKVTSFTGRMTQVSPDKLVPKGSTWVMTGKRLGEWHWWTLRSLSWVMAFIQFLVAMLAKFDESTPTSLPPQVSSIHIWGVLSRGYPQSSKSWSFEY